MAYLCGYYVEWIMGVGEASRNSEDMKYRLRSMMDNTEKRVGSGGFIFLASRGQISGCSARMMDYGLDFIIQNTVVETLRGHREVFENYLETYELVGRYRDGTSITDCRIRSCNTGKWYDVNKNLFNYLLGKGKIINCDGAIVNGKVQVKGKGINITKLPVVNKSSSKQYKINPVEKERLRRNREAELEMQGLRIERKVLDNNKRVIGYILRSAGGTAFEFSRAEVIEMARQGKILNARVQNYTDSYTGKKSVILRGVGIDLKKL